MAANALVDASFLIALLNRQDGHHRWAATRVRDHQPPWKTCDAVLSEAFFVLGASGAALDALLRRGAVAPAFDLGTELDRVLDLMKKYKDVPMSLADACLVRMTEIVADPLVLTTDADFRLYRRHGRQVVPCITP
jgi:uncharacterized protein